jgi:hypothetical protein
MGKYTTNAENFNLIDKKKKALQHWYLEAEKLKIGFATGCY